jgi:hypothetical protein
MATTRLSNIYNPLTFARRTQEAQTRLNRFLAAGIIAPDGLLQSQISVGGNIGELPFFKPLNTDEPNYSTDDPGSFSTPKNITSEKMRFRGAARNESWSTMDLARELALEDPVGAITGRIGHFWATDDEKRLIAACRGIQAKNVADFSGDMVLDISNDDAATVDPDAEMIGGKHVIDVLQTLGDHSFTVTSIAMHSNVYSKLLKDKLIDFVQEHSQTLQIPTYLGKRVIVDDSMPAIPGSNRIRYTSILFGGSIFGLANGKVMNPSEMERIPSAGDGGGQDIIYSRVHNFMHPNGFDFTSASVAGQSATYAELAMAENWDRKVARKLVPMAFLVTNG